MSFQEFLDTAKSIAKESGTVREYLFPFCENVSS